MKLLSFFWHSVDPDTIDSDYMDGTNPTASLFREQVEFLRARYTPVSPFEFLEAAKKKTFYTKPPVLLGFDDGFKNVLTQALPVLEEFRIPAVFFVIGQIIKDPNFVPWFIELKHLIRTAEKTLVVFSDLRFDLTSREDCARLANFFDISLRACRSEVARQMLLSTLANTLGLNRPVAADLDADLRFVNKEDLANLGAESFLTVASHAMTHRYLTSLTYEEQVAELHESDALLRKYCPSYLPIIAYPGGAVNADTISIAKTIYHAGFAVLLGSSYDNYYAYPRLGINYDTVQDLSYVVSPLRLNCLLPVKRILYTFGIEPSSLNYLSVARSFFRG
jgi:peptidoglycan/xylan/chitin deacetylase (PgdA/CDA1 family)